MMATSPVRTVASGSPEVAGGVQKPGFVYLPLSSNFASPTRLTRRSGTAGSAIIQNDLFTDLVNISIGGQTTTVILDTGSFELWVNPNCSLAATGSQYNTDLCEITGRYNPTLSNTSVKLDQDYTATYGKGSTNGSYYSDTVEVGGLSVKDQHFAVASNSESNPLGILGIGPDPYGGYNMSEPDIGVDLDTYMENPYSLLLTSMVSQGLINTRAFSLDMGGLDNATGAFILGGIDKGRFEGALQTFPLLSEQGTKKLDNGSTAIVELYACVHTSNIAVAHARLFLFRC